MLLIWGFKSYIANLGVITGVCSNCHNPAAHRIFRRTRKFTFFFIPLFPVSKKTFSTCTFCGTTTQLDDASRDAALAAIAAAGPAAVPVEPGMVSGTVPGTAPVEPSSQTTDNTAT